VAGRSYVQNLPGLPRQSPISSLRVGAIYWSAAANGHQPFAEWFADLDPVARAKVARVIARMEQGNLANVKSVCEGVLEYKIDFGPGYRVYFGRDGDTLLILLTGGTKKRQQRDINAAITYWQNYKRGKRGIR
jgi:putative addiction module killer protein